MRLETAECGGWSLLPAARCFLPSLQSGDVRFHVHIQKSLLCFYFVAAQTPQGLTGTSSSHYPLEQRSSGLCLSEPKPVFMPLHLKILLLLLQPIRPVRCTLTSLFPCRFHLVDLHCAHVTRHMCLSTSLRIILRICTYIYRNHVLAQAYGSTSLSILNSGSRLSSDSRVPISSNAVQISGYLSLAHDSMMPFFTCPGAALYTDPILSTH